MIWKVTSAQRDCLFPRWGRRTTKCNMWKSLVQWCGNRGWVRDPGTRLPLRYSYRSTLKPFRQLYFVIKRSWRSVLSVKCVFCYPLHYSWLYDFYVKTPVMDKLSLLPSVGWVCLVLFCLTWRRQLLLYSRRHHTQLRYYSTSYLLKH